MNLPTKTQHRLTELFDQRYDAMHAAWLLEKEHLYSGNGTPVNWNTVVRYFVSLERTKEMNPFRVVVNDLFPNGARGQRPEDQMLAMTLDVLADLEDAHPRENSVSCAFSEVLVRFDKHKGTQSYRALAQRLNQTNKVSYQALLT